MLKKKEYTAILGLAKTKDEIVQFYISELLSFSCSARESPASLP